MKMEMESCSKGSTLKNDLDYYGSSKSLLKLHIPKIKHSIIRLKITAEIGCVRNCSMVIWEECKG